jgi:hypothetical protein
MFKIKCLLTFCVRGIYILLFYYTYNAQFFHYVTLHLVWSVWKSYKLQKKKYFFYIKYNQRLFTPSKKLCQCFIFYYLMFYLIYFENNFFKVMLGRNRERPRSKEVNVTWGQGHKRPRWWEANHVLHQVHFMKEPI